MINLKLYTLQERTPEHNQEVVWLEYGSTFGYETIGIKHGTVEYTWSDEIGTCCGYNYEEPQDMQGWTLVITIEGYILEGKNAWCTVDEYFECIDEGTKENNVSST